MESKKKLVEDLKKYNQELDKHLPEIDFDTYSSNFSQSSNNDSDLTNLMLSNLVDLRTELNLLRKHVTTDVSGMVASEITKNNRHFSETLTTFQRTFIMELKQSFGLYVEELTNGFNDMKKEFNDFKGKVAASEMTVSDLTMKVEDMRENLLSSNSDVSELRESMLIKITEVENLIRTDLNVFEDVVKNFGSLFSKEFKIFDRRLEIVSRKLDTYEEDLNVSPDSVLRSSFDRLSHMKLNSNNNLRSNGNEVRVNSNYGESKGEKSELQLPRLNVSVDERSQKMLDIDEKIRRLSSLVN